MVSIREIKNDNNREKYRDKALSLSVSPNMLSVQINKYSINFIKLIKEINDKNDLDNILRNKLIETSGKDFYDYSIFLGLHYGVYNLYCYNHLSEVLIKRVLKKEPSVENTKKIFNTYKNEIIIFLVNKYNIEKEDIEVIINKMFTVIEDYSLYNEEIVKDINKILIGIELKFDKEKITNHSNTIKNSILLGEVIDYYDEINQKDKEIPSIFQKYN